MFFSLGIISEDSIICPIASSVSVFAPKVIPAIYDLSDSRKKDENRVALLIARITKPSAIGSNVPRWPTFLSERDFLTS